MNLTKKKGPLYLQVKDILKKRIIDGVYPKHSHIPPEPILEEEFGVSKITVRKAVEQLVHEGYLEKSSGVGTTVLDNRAVSKLSKGQNFTEFLISEGFSIHKGNVKISTVDVAEHPILASQYGETCVCVSRTYFLNDQPYIHFSHYFPNEFSMPFEPEVYKTSLYELLHRKGITFQRFTDEFSVEIPSEEVSKQLNIEQKPLMQRIRFSYNDEDQLVEYSEAFYNTDVHKYVINFDI